LCMNELPLLPSHILLQCGDRAEEPLLRLLEDSALPQPARALAAMTLGALQRDGDSRKPRSSATFGDGWIRRAAQWGVQEGLPECPALIVTLLAEKDGVELAKRYL